MLIYNIYIYIYLFILQIFLSHFGSFFCAINFAVIYFSQYKNQDLSQKELRNINGYKSMPKDKSLRIIDNNNNNDNNNHHHDYSNNNNNRDRKSLLKSKKGIYKPTRNSLLKLKR